jgi:hypothetical protein
MRFGRVSQIRQWTFGGARDRIVRLAAPPGRYADRNQVIGPECQFGVLVVIERDPVERACVTQKIIAFGPLVAG